MLLGTALFMKIFTKKHRLFINLAVLGILLLWGCPGPDTGGGETRQMNV
jgi:hypothetical protein